MATRETVPARGEVMAASIFIASMEAIVCPASTLSPSATLSVMTPAKGAATWPGSLRSAFSAALSSESMSAADTPWGAAANTADCGKDATSVSISACDLKRASQSTVARWGKAAPIGSPG